MPRMTPESRAARRHEILDAAHRCFARKGFSATTIADLCEESGISAGGIYTHFENKHAIAAAIGNDATDAPDEPLDLAAMGRRLWHADGEEDARLDLQLWAESLHDPVLHAMVSEAMDRFRSAVLDNHAGTAADDGTAGVIEALVLGAEVQRALGRAMDPTAMASAIERLTAPDDTTPTP
ncbi:TetR/AcrR family transcriptional regulator [Ilumatobacter coccineus]|uniref:Putative TetR family transcriptional regulator n=1 Tax=Ilumatobacter coccineus (strain NBRC 103263 / KCTC 29153 / YM16-304) TaxID=1313172 RepID=A0A6C7EBQ1_ILUCY|nr:TetR/AcrR family transcriptional regulator [Ilumatobacter coccineus]BAN01446.1 putative TetR family transcriptional regulator [Ilumatobacter coccineus YM16-304]